MNLTKNVSTVFLGNIVYSMSKYSLLIIINHFLGATDAGYYTYAMAIIAPIYLFLRMSLRTYIATNVDETYSLINYLYITVINGIIGLIFLNIINLFSNIEDYLFIIILIYAVHFLFDSVYEISYGIYQRSNQFNYITTSKVVRGILQTIIFGIIVYTTNQLHYGLIGLVIFDLVFYHFWEFNRTFSNYRKGNINFIKIYKKVIIEALPLGISTSLNSFLTNIPKYFLEIFVSISAVGYYTSIVYIIQLGQMLITAINQTVVSELSLSFFNNFSRYYNIKKKLLLINFSIGSLFIIGGLLIGEEILVFLYGNDYIGSQNILIIILIAGLFWYITSAYHISISATRKYNKRLIILIFSIISSLLISYLLIPSFGIIGASLSLLMNYVVKAIISYFVLRSIEKSVVNKGVL